MSKYLLGIDIGTSACKVVLFDFDGNVLAAQSQEYSVYFPSQGYAEQNPDEWWTSVCSAVRTLISNSGINSADIGGIGIDGQSWSAIAVDKSGQALCNTPIWMDNRASDICEELLKTIDEDSLFSLCGNPLKPSYTLPKVVWYKKNLPDVYKNTDKILQSNSYIVFKMTGKITQDKSQGYGWQCFDMRKCQWDKDMCKDFGINPYFLPEIMECHDIAGAVTREAAAMTGLCEGTPVVAGGLDAACATLGAGVVSHGQTQEQGGQAGGMSICTDTYTADKRLILSTHAASGKWLLQGGTVGGGGVLRWFDREFGSGDFKALDTLAAEVISGSDGVLFLPYMAGERSPIWNPDAKGIFYGLDYSKTKGHMIRAMLEGVAFSLKHNLDIAEQSGLCAEKLFAVGGAANSPLWMQIKADVTQKPLEIPFSDSAAALGAALLAGVGTGVYNDFDHAVSKTVKITKKYAPNTENAEIYNNMYERYLELYTRIETF